MKKGTGKPLWTLAIFSVLVLALAIYFVLDHEKTLVTHPMGIIAKKQLDLIITLYVLMFIIVIPTFIWLFAVAWKYRVKNNKAQIESKKSESIYEPEKHGGPWVVALLWIAPAIIVAIMVFKLWEDTHELDPYKPIESTTAHLVIQVVALDWKWLFIYPEQEIATVNFVQFPINTPIRFELAADGSPMNSFWIPQLSGQIYAMTGMITPLHIMADVEGIYAGRAAEINGKGYASMHFTAKATSLEDFEKWVEDVRTMDWKLTKESYIELAKPTVDHPTTFFSHVEQNLFNNIVMKYMDHPSNLWKTSSTEN
jgi:cytochrome o ubiquinol oxidase subunit II